MSEIEKTRARDIEVRNGIYQPKNLEEAFRLAEAMSKSEIVPNNFRGKPNDILVAVQMGAEAGLSPMAALQNIAVISGRVCLWGDAALALVRNHPDCMEVHETIEGEGDKMKATCSIMRKGQGAPIVRTFSAADARRANLWTKAGPWQQYPQRMLQMRARSWAMRDSFPDALKGLSVREEVQDIPETTAERIEAATTASAATLNERLEAARKPKVALQPAEPDKQASEMTHAELDAMIEKRDAERVPGELPF